MIAYTSKKEALIALFDGTHKELEQMTKRQVSFVLDDNYRNKVVALANMSEVAQAVIFRKLIEYGIDEIEDGFDQESKERFHKELLKIFKSESEAK